MIHDLTFLRALFTLLAFATFLGLVGWAWLRGRRNGFAQAASLPFDDAPETTDGGAR